VNQRLPPDPPEEPPAPPLDPPELPERLPLLDPPDPLIPPDPPWDPPCDPLVPPVLLLDPVLPGVPLDPIDSFDSRFSSPYPVPEPGELPREALEAPVDPLEPLIPPEPLVLPDPERESLPLFPDPLIPLDPLELPDEPDEPRSFLFWSFAIRPPALFGRTDNTNASMRSNASAAQEKKQHSRHLYFSCIAFRDTIRVTMSDTGHIWDSIHRGHSICPDRNRPAVRREREENRAARPRTRYRNRGIS